MELEEFVTKIQKEYEDDIKELQKLLEQTKVEPEKVYIYKSVVTANI